MKPNQLCVQLFVEFAEPITTVHSASFMGEDGLHRSAQLKSSNCLVLSIGKKDGKSIVGVRTGRLNDTESPLLFWVREAQEGGLEFTTSPLLNSHADKSIIGKIIARMEELEKELELSLTNREGVVGRGVSAEKGLQPH